MSVDKLGMLPLIAPDFVREDVSRISNLDRSNRTLVHSVRLDRSKNNKKWNCKSAAVGIDQENDVQIYDKWNKT